MIEQKVFDTLTEEFGHSASWTVWSEPANGNWKSKDSISDMTLFSDKKNLINILNQDYIFVGLNPAVHADGSYKRCKWDHFHSSDTKRSQDYKLRYALRGTKYWGSLITDIYPEIRDTDSDNAMRKVTNDSTYQSVERILRIREMLGGIATVVAIGNKSFSVLSKSLPNDVELKKITHYSSYVNIDEYRQMVLQQLNEDSTERTKVKKSTFKKDDVTLLYESFITLCSYIKNDIGCEKCPMNSKSCKAKK